jgi:hypothetical protein
VSTPARRSASRAVPASPIAGTRHRPLPIPSMRLVGGPLAAWQQRNGERDTLVLRCRVINAADGRYGPDTATGLGDEHTVTAIPLTTWGNRAPGPMRVCLPRAPRRGLH